VNELILFEKKVATRKEIENLFSQENGLKPILKTIEEMAYNFSYDLDTKEGREKIASQAYAVSRTKTFLDNVGKELTSEWRDKTAKVNSGRNEVKKFLDDLKDNIRKPLTELEEKEKAEKERKEQTVKNLEMVLLKYHPMSEVEAMNEAFNKVKLVPVEDGNWGEEFEYKIHKAKSEALAHLEDCITKRKTHDAEQAELKKLREAEEKRKAEEAEQERIKEAAEKARREAEEKAKIEKEQAEKAQHLAEQRAIEAEEKLKKQEEERKLQQQKLEEEKKEEEVKAQRFKENEREIKREVHNAILEFFVNNGFNQEQGKKIVTLIAKLEVPHLVVNYGYIPSFNTRYSEKEKVEPSFRLN